MSLISPTYLVDNIVSAWIAYKDKPINVYALSERIVYKEDLLQLEFPFDPATCEELNCIVSGVDYTIESDYPTKICFINDVRRSPFILNNYTRLPYKIDRSPEARDIIAYTDEEEEIIVCENKTTPLKHNQIRFIDDTKVECSQNLIGKRIKVSCSILIKRWVNNLSQKINTPLKCFLANNSELQVLQGDLVVANSVDLYAPTRIVSLKNLQQLSRETL